MCRPHYAGFSELCRCVIYNFKTLKKFRHLILPERGFARYPTNFRFKNSPGNQQMVICAEIIDVAAKSY